MLNRNFLNWLADRIIKVYGEDEHDFVLRLRKIANSFCSLCNNLAMPDDDLCSKHHELHQRKDLP